MIDYFLNSTQLNDKLDVLKERQRVLLKQKKDVKSSCLYLFFGYGEKKIKNISIELDKVDQSIKEILLILTHSPLNCGYDILDR